MREHALVGAVVSYVRLLAYAAWLTVWVAWPQVVARIVAGNLCTSTKTGLVQLVWPEAC